MQLQGGAAGGAELLAVLPKLTSLTYLGLSRIYELVSCPAAAFSSLTSSSSSLQHLILSGCSGGGNRWQHMFPPNRRLPQLKTLNLCYARSLGQGDLQACVSCCPNLQQLNLACALADGVQLHPLLRLSGLTNLSMGLCDADISVLTQLTELQELSCCAPNRSQIKSITAPGLLRLTALTQLTQLIFLYSNRFRQLFDTAAQEPQARQDLITFTNKVGIRSFLAAAS